MKKQTKGKILLLAAVLFSSLNSIFGIISIHFSSQVLAGMELGSMDFIFRMLLLSALALALRLVFWILAVMARTSYLSNGVVNIRDRMIKSILKRPICAFRKQDNSYYLNLLGEDAELYRNNWLNTIPCMLSALASVLSNAIMLCFLHPALLLVGIVTSAIPLIAANLFTKVTQERRNLVSQNAETYTEVLKEGIEGYETLRFSRGQESFILRFHTASQKKAEAQRNSVIVNNLSFMTLLASGGIAQLVCLGVAGYLSTLGLVTIASLYAAVSYIGDLSNALSNVMEYVIDFRASKPLVKKLRSETEVPYPADGSLVSEENQSLIYSDISFSFGTHQLYNGLSCSFAPGGCYAILGESGSGKSTLIKLLLKYYDDYEGTITLAGQDIRTLTEDEICRVVGLVNQSPFLFNATLYDNITMFTNDPPKESDEYQQLLSTLNLVSLAKRTGDTSLGDFGDNISGGERQRINIARALRSRTSIIIFDEPTTGLDPENAALINEFIFSYKEATRIVITHDWSPEYLSKFDGVIFVDKAKSDILEQ